MKPILIHPEPPDLSKMLAEFTRQMNSQNAVFTRQMNITVESMNSMKKAIIDETTRQRSHQKSKSNRSTSSRSRQSSTKKLSSKSKRSPAASKIPDNISFSPPNPPIDPLKNRVSTNNMPQDSESNAGSDSDLESYPVRAPTKSLPKPQTVSGPFMALAATDFNMTKLDDKLSETTLNDDSFLTLRHFYQQINISLSYANKQHINVLPYFQKLTRKFTFQNLLIPEPHIATYNTCVNRFQVIDQTLLSNLTGPNMIKHEQAP